MATDSMDPFGANEWLVDELYDLYQQDKSKVDPTWWEFFADYSPANGVRPTPLTVPVPAAAEAPAAAPASPPVAATPAAPVTPAASSAPAAKPAEAGAVVLKGPAARVVTNMEASLTVPTATSVRAVPARLLEDNRTVINNHLARTRGGKVSFTHLIGYAVVQAATEISAMNGHFTEVDAKPAIVATDQVNLGLAIDLTKPDGTRQLLVPSIKAAQDMDFSQFLAAYEDIVRKARNNKLTVDDFAGTTLSLTNPGGLGTNLSVPRLMTGQGCIIGVGSLDYPAEWEGASEEAIARNAVSRILTLTSTYDHRIIQGAQSGEFLRRIHELLLGRDGFYDEIFKSLRIPYEPIRWAKDISANHETDLSKATRVQEIIHAYRVRGHLLADTDPLETRQPAHPDLDTMSHSLTLWDLDRVFPTGGFGGKELMKFREILKVLRDSYTRTIGIEYMHIQDPEQRKWIQDEVEGPHVRPERAEQLRILHKLNEAEALESFLQTKFVGQKRFSLEGGDSLIPLLDEILIGAADENLIEVAIGMPHRGRLNVLTNIAGKSYAQIFREFEGDFGPESVQGSGDVKYHLGTTGHFTAPSGATTSVYLAANPSHLEAVNPVLEGIVRAKQDQLPRGESSRILPILMHGDAAFAGQGVVAETLQMSQIQGYRTEGTIHIVVNNQVGFTTSPRYSRSSVYSTDIARTIQAPIFHVNGDDPEAVVRIARLAFDYRQKFHRDVVIDLVCYRRRGHNEADDPSLTQPLMYKIIDNKRSVRKHYTESLIGRGDITVEEAEEALKHFQAQLER
ncbi:MAG: multifunctional oxoglutarate decarboxylase/oxoglutarate dehydrogenase thiamine pyrophosphate-binding subunit/dihydrolipoyllysine-residue succinyltransferase subunit, partial [Candidatus Nanopelagicales bacterium]